MVQLSRFSLAPPARAAALAAFVFFFSSSAGSAVAETQQLSNIEVANRAVVHISSTFFTHSYENPWNAPLIRRASGTGFIIAGNRIVTNAHVVSQANTLRVQRPTQRTDYEARVLHIAHDCDLAMLVVEDPAFFEDSTPLEIGPTPALNTSVEVIGFPIGGDRVSITRGVVSRMGMDTYSHSQIDSHLTLQV
ncbi:MAG: serine protease, partial [Leptospirales bacterium]